MKKSKRCAPWASCRKRRPRPPQPQGPREGTSPRCRPSYSRPARARAPGGDTQPLISPRTTGEHHSSALHRRVMREALSKALLQ
eukprot:3703073-Pyramimonas_sp.AAC.1